MYNTYFSINFKTSPEFSYSDNEKCINDIILDEMKEISIISLDSYTRNPSEYAKKYYKYLIIDSKLKGMSDFEHLHNIVLNIEKRFKAEISKSINNTMWGVKMIKR